MGCGGVYSPLRTEKCQRGEVAAETLTPADKNGQGAGNTTPQSPKPPHPSQAWIEAVLTVTRAHRGPGRHGKWQCPAHGRTGEHSLALATGTRTDGTAAWVFCHGGCTGHEILRALGLTMAHLRQPPAVSPERHVRCARVAVGYPPPKAGDGSPRELGYRHEAFHYYGEGFRKERLRHPTTRAKAVQWEARNPAGLWVPGLLGTREADLPLYRERDIQRGIALGEPVVLVESESSVDALKGWYATTWAGGAGSPPLLTIRRVLADYPRVVVIADADDAGRRCAQRLTSALPLAHVVEPEIDGEDARDLYNRIGPADFATTVNALLSGTVRGSSPDLIE